MKRNSILWTTVILLIGSLTRLVAQPNASTGAGAESAAGKNLPASAAKKAGAPDAQETADADKLVQALNAGDGATAASILSSYGVAKDTVSAMSPRFGATPARVPLSEPFLKAAAALSLSGKGTNAHQRLQLATSLGYDRPVWYIPSLEADWVTRYDSELQNTTVPPIAVLNVRMQDPTFIRFCKWYDRHAERLHSVVVNGDDLTNAKYDQNYERANLILNAFYRFIKARKPDAFVWLSVVKQDDHSDEPWLKAMTFKPDGLQISNLRQFHSPFADTRRRFVEIVGEDMPMMVAGFYGYKAALQEKGKTITFAKKPDNAKPENGEATAAQAANAQKKAADAVAELGGIGAAVGDDLEELETTVQSLGYRGISAHFLLLQALASKNNGRDVGKSDLPDSRIGSLVTYHVAQDFQSMSNMVAVMLSETKPGEMTWAAAKLYQGIVFLSQAPPDIDRGAAALDEVLAFDFKGRPGRDHYIIGAARWRIYAALLAGDKAKAQSVVQWVESREFRPDLKAQFLKQSTNPLLPPATTQSK